MLRCAICGKVIATEAYNMKEYAYKKSGVYTCSWTCFNKITGKTLKELKKLRAQQQQALRETVDLVEE